MNRANRLLAAALAAIVVLAVAAALVSANRSVPQVQSGSPEATVQSYIEAVLDGRNDDAVRLLAPDSDCGIEDLDRGMHAAGARVVLLDSSVDADTARVRVRLVYGSAEPFNPSENSEEHTYRLTKANGEWLLTGVPWPLYDCWKES